MTKNRVVIVGGGIVGLATAYRLLQRFPDWHVTLLEKESEVAAHQTGRNSGVIHSGIYYKPGSLKAINCRAGLAQMFEFCQEHAIPHERCGKVIVALAEGELSALNRIFERGKANGVDCEFIDRGKLLDLEPYASGIKAIHVRDTGIVNYRRVAERLVSLVRDRGGDIQLGSKVQSVTHAGNASIIRTTAGDFTAQRDRQLRRPLLRPHRAAIGQQTASENCTLSRRVF